MQYSKSKSIWIVTAQNPEQAEGRFVHFAITMDPLNFQQTQMAIMQANKHLVNPEGKQFWV